MAIKAHVLFENDNHKNYLLDDWNLEQRLAVHANQHLIIHNGAGMILDPGGHKIFSKAFAETSVCLHGGKLKYIFLSHQDPDVVAALNGWLMMSDAVAYASALWMRFIPHFGVDSKVLDRLKPIPDEGMYLDLNGAELMLLPAHFLHSCGNFQVYDPLSKILYSGDLGAAPEREYLQVEDFAAHAKLMAGFHRRYMVSSIAMRAWVNMVKDLDIETIAPQHGAWFKGKDMVHQFVDWCGTLECGIDWMVDKYRIPDRPL